MDRDDLSKLKKLQLSKLLEDRGIPCDKLTKSEIIEKIIKENISPVNKLSAVIQQSSSLQSLIPVLPCKDVSFENLPPFNCVNYSSSISILPSIDFISVYNHLILRKIADESQLKNYRGFDRAVQHFEAGDVHDLKLAQVNNNIVYAHCTCRASMKKLRYTVYVCMSTKGDLLYSVCECPVGLAQSCSHIGAVLLYIHESKKSQQEDISCTSQICKWNVPRPMAIIPKPLHEIPFSKKPNTLETFDPRHPSQRTIDHMHVTNSLKSLKEIFPNTGMNSLWQIPDVSMIVNEDQIMTDIAFEQEITQKSTKMVFEGKTEPPQKASPEVIRYIEEQTRDQRKSKLWLDMHRGRITSSIIHRVISSGKPSRSLVEQIMCGSALERYTNLPPAVSWGVENEKNAREAYLRIRNIASEVAVKKTGLTLHPEYAFLGASSDGRVLEEDIDNGQQEGVLEIKCPYSVDGTIITHHEIDELLKFDKCCLEKGVFGVQLKRSHPFYTQVQAEMAIMQLPWTDFVLWTAAQKNNIFIERIAFDSAFSDQMIKSVVSYYQKYISPEMQNQRQFFQ